MSMVLTAFGHYRSSLHRNAALIISHLRPDCLSPAAFLDASEKKESLASAGDLPRFLSCVARTLVTHRCTHWKLRGIYPPLAITGKGMGAIRSKRDVRGPAWCWNLEGLISLAVRTTTAVSWSVKSEVYK
jgi:hypothetical protein